MCWVPLVLYAQKTMPAIERGGVARAGPRAVPAGLGGETMILTRPSTSARRLTQARPPLVRLVTRLAFAQTLTAGFTGLPFGRRHLSSILITLALVAGCFLVALMVRTGGRAAWSVAVCYEMAFFLYGLSRFMSARYVGGTLFSLVIAGTLMHPAVARAYSATSSRFRGHPAAESSAPSRP